MRDPVDRFISRFNFNRWRWRCTCFDIVTLVGTPRMCDDDDFVSCRDLVDENQWMRSAKFYVNQQKERRGSNMTRCSNTIKG